MTSEKNKLQYISLWIAIATLGWSQFSYSYHEYQIHCQLRSQEQMILQMMEDQAEIDESQLEILQRLIEDLSTFLKTQKSVQKQDVQPVKHIFLQRRDYMEQQYDMKMTEERKRKVEEILQTLFEDQYGCKLVRSSAKKVEVSA